MNDNKTNTPIIVLAGGFGTRLKSELGNIPKALADINGKPFLEILLNNLIDNGFRNFIFSLYHESDQIIDFLNGFKKIISAKCKFQYVVEPKALGTGGAVAYVVSHLKLKNEIFIINSDTWIGSGHQEICLDNYNTIGLIEMEDCRRYGKVVTDNDNFILKFSEKDNIKSSGLINAGIYRLRSSLFYEWNGEPFSMENSLFPILVKNKQLKGIKLDTTFTDIGIPDDYKKFKNEIRGI